MIVMSFRVFMRLRNEPNESSLSTTSWSSPLWNKNFHRLHITHHCRYFDLSCIVCFSTSSSRFPSLQTLLRYTKFLREHSRTTTAWGIGGCKAESNSLIWNDVDWKIGIYFVVIKGPFSAASVDIDVYIFQMQRADTPVLPRLHPSSSRTILTSPLYPLYSTLFIHLREVFFPHFLVFLQDLPYLFLYFE